ncbi:MAG: hypothetical protein DWQ07_06225 [Chloroflexi bacterium]|nr:MAG: hypothetical protein DWQ07_06225 [Chloroflexota bacterium]MBL1195974.1 hypothetical protein [Chloroflexota bacterium]NOH13268.1 hypothetical protein [Chloroflexota bacterium]
MDDKKDIWIERLYRGYIFGGFAGIVLVAGVLAFLFPRGPQWVVILLSGCVTVYLIGILLYWWWQILFAGYGQLEAMAENPPEGLPPLSALSSKTKMHEALSIHGGDIEELISAQKKSRRNLIEFFFWMNVIVVVTVGVGGWGHLLFGLLEQYRTLYIIFLVAFLIFVMIRNVMLAGSSMRAGEGVYFKPLGLYTVETPNMQSLLDIEAYEFVVAGERRGRQIEIVVQPERTLTAFEAQLPEFEIVSENGKLVVGKGTPVKIREDVEGLRKAKRWRGIEIKGGEDGLVITRNKPRGENPWMYDIWLGEYLLE